MSVKIEKAHVYICVVFSEGVVDLLISKKIQYRIVEIIEYDH